MAPKRKRGSKPSLEPVIFQFPTLNSYVYLYSTPTYPDMPTNVVNSLHWRNDVARLQKIRRTDQPEISSPRLLLSSPFQSHLPNLPQLNWHLLLLPLLNALSPITAHLPVAPQTPRPMKRRDLWPFACSFWAFYHLHHHPMLPDHPTMAPTSAWTAKWSASARFAP